MSSEDMLGGGGLSHYAPDMSTIGPLSWQLGGVYTHTLVQEWYPLQADDPLAGQNMHTYR